MIKKIQILFLLYIIVTITSSTFAGLPLWGLSSWSAVSYTTQIVLAAILLLLLIGGINQKILNIFNRIRLSDRWISIIILGIMVILMWQLRSGHDYWGERVEISEAVTNGIFFVPGAPLALMLNQLIFILANSILLLSASSATTLLSIISGGVYILLAAFLSRALHREGKYLSENRTLSLLVVVSGGYFTLFFGSGGNTPLAMLFVILFVVSSITHIRGNTPLWLTAFLFILSIMASLSTLFLLPGFAYLAAVDFREKDRRRGIIPAITVIVILYAAADLSPFWGGSFSGPSRSLFALFREFTHFLASGNTIKLFSDLSNALLLAGPVSITALFFLLTSKRNRHHAAQSSLFEERFLATASVSAFLFLILTAQKIESGLRWDIIAVSGPVFAAYSLWALNSRLAFRSKFGYAALLIFALGIFHSTPMIAISHSDNLGIKRIRELPLPQGGPEKIIGNRYFEKRQFAEATEWLQLSAGKNGEDASVWSTLATINTMEDRKSDAVSNMIKAARLRPDDMEYSEKLAEAYIENNWMEEAIAEYIKLKNADSTRVRYWIRLGYAYNHSSRYDEAIRTYETVLEFDPENDQYLKNLTSALLNKGVELQKEKEYEEAKRYYERARRTYPTDWIASNNLAMIAMEKKEFKQAHKILSEALRSNDFSPTLHYNMALVEEEMGNYSVALDHLRRCGELNRTSPPPNDDIERISKKLREQEKSPR
ncbi:MAG: tetratricopeptide repeat protein [Candidatus Krumholzibacteriota bacterium]|nr:tetratricopeptide repeat protein [Candidatus Krumholzibacteriota bacterium]